jgi:hypothetical protein
MHPIFRPPCLPFLPSFLTGHSGFVMQLISSFSIRAANAIAAAAMVKVRTNVVGSAAAGGGRGRGRAEDYLCDQNIFRVARPSDDPVAKHAPAGWVSIGCLWARETKCSGIRIPFWQKHNERDIWAGIGHRRGWVGERGRDTGLLLGNHFHSLSLDCDQAAAADRQGSESADHFSTWFGPLRCLPHWKKERKRKDWGGSIHRHSSKSVYSENE